MRTLNPNRLHIDGFTFEPSWPWPEVMKLWPRSRDTEVSVVINTSDGQFCVDSSSVGQHVTDVCLAFLWQDKEHRYECTFLHPHKPSSYIVQYPVLKITLSAYTLLPRQTCSITHRLNFSGKHPAICYNEFTKAAPRLIHNCVEGNHLLLHLSTTE